jgi:Flp pilus assembly protein protease CpaA
VDVRIRRIPFILSFILAVLGLRRPWVPGGPGPFGGLASASGTFLALLLSSRLSGGGMGGGDIAFAASAALFLRPVEAFLFLAAAALLGTLSALLRSRSFPLSAAADPSIAFAPSLSGGLFLVACLRVLGARP